MGYIYFNDNPYGLDTGDCVIRAISVGLNYNWYMVHDEQEREEIRQLMMRYPK